jgi:type IX secretion system PorP/SprF family membrane protein
MNTKTTIKIIVIVAFIFLAEYGAAQQHMQFTQYMSNNLIINPGYAGAEGPLSITLLNRSQWTGIKNSPTTQTLSINSLLKRKHIGVGLNLVNDKIGAHKNLYGLLNYSYHLKTGKYSALSFGLMAGFQNQKTNFALLVGSANDPSLNTSSTNHLSLKLGAGIYFRSKRFHAGLSSPTLLPGKLRVSDTVVYKHSANNIFFYSQMTYPINNELEAMPSVLIKYFSNVPMNFDVNLNFVYRRVIWWGLSYRYSESIGLILKAKVTSMLQFGYAYDYPTSAISKISNGSHELMVNYLFKATRKKFNRPR